MVNARSLAELSLKVVEHCPFLEALELVFDVTPTPAQRVLYATLFDGAPVPDTDLGRALFGFAGDPPVAARRTAALVKGARIGGTRLGALGGLHRALSLPAPSLGPREPVFVAFVAPDMRLARQALGFVGQAIEMNAGLSSRLVGPIGADQICLRRSDGREARFVVFPATATGSALRGRWYAWVQFVEGAHFRDANYVVNDADLYRAVVPRIVPGGLILVESTPWSETGLLYEFFRDNFGAAKWATVARAPTRLIRTDSSTLLADVENEFARDAENAAQEYGAEFLSTRTGLFFDARAIDDCIDDSIDLSKPRGVSAGADWGFESDSCALVLSDMETDGKIRIGAASEQQPRPGAPLQPSAVVADFAAIMKEGGARSVMSDAHYRQAIIEHLGKHGLFLEDAPGGADGKMQTYLKFRELVNSRKLRLPRHPRLLAQLKAIVSRPRAGGGLQIMSPRVGGGRAGHGDVASAAILSVWVAASAGAGLDYGRMMAALKGRHLFGV